MLNKEVQIKVYSKTGAFITTLQDTLISTSVSFDLQINSWVGRLSFNYHDDYAFNITDVIQVNDWQGRVIYRGWISNKKTSITSTGNVQTIEAQWMQTLLNSLYFPDWVVTDDPKNILEDILDVYNATAIFRREYDFVTYWSSISVEFTNDTLLSAINKVLENQSFYLYFGMDWVATYTPTVIKDRVGTNDWTPSWVTISDGAMVFDWVNDSIVVSSFTLNNVFSVSINFTPDKFFSNSDAAAATVFWMDTTLWFRLETPWRYRWYCHNWTSYTSTYVNDWNSVLTNTTLTFTYDWTSGRFYKDWSLVFWPVTQTLTASLTKALYLWVQVSSRFFDWSINFLQIHDRALNATEITQIYNAWRYSPSPVRTGLIAEYYHSNIAWKVEYKDYETWTHHIVNLWNEVNAIDIDYNGQQLQNDLTIEYDWGTTTVADSTSISLHWTYKKYIKDTSIKNLATATERWNAILAKNAYPKEQTKVILNREYDIESIKPWQTISVLNTNESVKNKTIQRIRYSIQWVELEVDEFDTIEKSVKKSLSS